jgi:hypothetical protein
MRKLVAIGVGFVLAVACSSDEETDAPGGDPGCGKDPWACGAGETCWPVTASGHLECIDAPTDQIEGAPCQFVVGQAMCAPHLYCFPTTQGSSSGVCSPFCNQGVCLNGGTCTLVSLIGGKESVQVCTPNVGDSGTGGDAGTDSSVGGTGGIAGNGGTGGIAGSGGTVTGGAGGVAGSAGNGGTAGQGGTGGQGGTAGTSSGGTAGTSSGGSAGTSSGGNAGTSSGGASGSAGATP